MKYFASENKLFQKVISHFNILTKCCIFANLDNVGKIFKVHTVLLNILSMSFLSGDHDTSGDSGCIKSSHGI